MTFRLGVVGAAGAVSTGAALMWAMGAPLAFAGINLIALPATIGVAWVCSRWACTSRSQAAFGMGLAGALLLPLLFGPAMAGVHRWLAPGGVMVQPAAVLLPALAMLAADGEHRWTIAAVALASVALALQPDRAYAASLASAMAVAAVMRPHPISLDRFLLALAGCAVALARPDPLAPAPFVEGVVHSAATASPWLGAVALLSQGLLLLPALAHDRPVVHRAVWAATWGTLIVAALVGNFPTPLTGYGASAILGYGVALGGFTRVRAGDKRVKSG